MNHFESVLILAPRTDDGEIGCGGVTVRLVEEGKQVYYVAFSTARTSVRPDCPDNILEIEVKEATHVLGIPPDNLIIHEFPVRHPGSRHRSDPHCQGSSTHSRWRHAQRSGSGTLGRACRWTHR